MVLVLRRMEVRIEKKESTNLIVLRCYPTPSYDVEVDVNDDDDVKDEDKDDKDQSINIVVFRC